MATLAQGLSAGFSEVQSDPAVLNLDAVEVLAHGLGHFVNGGAVQQLHQAAIECTGRGGGQGFVFSAGQFEQLDLGDFNFSGGLVPLRLKIDAKVTVLLHQLAGPLAAQLDFLALLTQLQCGVVQPDAVLFFGKLFGDSRVDQQFGDAERQGLGRDSHAQGQ